MNRTAAERRHHRERVIRNRENERLSLGEHPADKPGMLDKNHGDIRWWKRSEQGKGNYVVRGVTKYGYWDDPFEFNTRQALKRELRNELGGQ